MNNDPSRGEDLSQRCLWSLTWRPMVIAQTPIHDLEYAALTNTGNRRVYWMRMAPGSRSPQHRHMGEEVLVIWEGEVEDSDGRLLKAGASLVYAPGSEHHLRSQSGCVMLVIESEPAVLLP